eukprot:1126020-Rhodomonas_salina.1
MGAAQARSHLLHPPHPRLLSLAPASCLSSNVSPRPLQQRRRAASCVDQLQGRSPPPVALSSASFCAICA